MKKKISVLVSVMLTAAFTCNLYAQVSKSATIKNTEVVANTGSGVVTVNGSGSGCDIIFTNKSAAGDMAPVFRFYVSSADNSLYMVQSQPNVDPGPPIEITKQKTKSNQANEKTVPVTITGVTATLKLRTTEPGKTLPLENVGFTLPADVADGEYKLIISGNWGNATGGSPSFQTTFALIVVQGSFQAIKTKGTGGT